MMSKDGSKKLGWKKDWPALLYLSIVMIGFVVTIYDFWILQHLNLQLNVFLVIGVILIGIGGFFRVVSRMTLTKAGFTMVNSYKLQIVGNQRLITEGVYSHIRHPLYLGEMSRNLGFALLFSSLYGLLVIVIANICLVIRIQIEERMLVAQFGNEYEEYKKRTKKLIPYIY
jgi:protein-S-isoprenylcysteine O-methyltransferase Ste14